MAARGCSFNMLLTWTERIMVKVLDCHLNLVILLCRLHPLPQIIRPLHSRFHLNSTGSTHPGCSLVHRTDQLAMPLLPSLYHFKLLWYGRGSGNGLVQGPSYDWFSQDSNPWSIFWSLVQYINQLCHSGHTVHYDINIKILTKPNWIYHCIMEAEHTDD